MWRKIIPHTLDTSFSDGMNRPLKMSKTEESQIKHLDGKLECCHQGHSCHTLPVTSSGVSNVSSKNHVTAECRKVGKNRGMNRAVPLSISYN